MNKVSEEQVVKPEIQETVGEPFEFVDCTGDYCPPFVEAALENGKMIKVKGRKGTTHCIGTTHFVQPRLKHRSDLRKYISDESDLPFVKLSQVNPFCADNGMWTKVFEILREGFSSDIVGYLNEIPVYKVPVILPEGWCGVNSKSCKYCKDCGFCSTCEFAGDTACVFRPGQFILWGTKTESGFFESEPVCGQSYFTWEILNIISQKYPDIYNRYADGLNSEEVNTKFERHIAAVQRTSISSYNCYGLPTVQCGLFINTFYNNKDYNNKDIKVYLSLNPSKHIIASWREQKKLLKKHNQV